MNKLREKVVKEEQNRKQLEEHHSEVMAEKQQLYMQLQREQDVAAEAQENIDRLLSKKGDLEQNIQVCNILLWSSIHRVCKLVLSLSVAFRNLKRGLKKRWTTMPMLEQPKERLRLLWNMQKSS